MIPSITPISGSWNHKYWLHSYWQLTVGSWQETCQCRYLLLTSGSVDDDRQDQIRPDLSTGSIKTSETMQFFKCSRYYTKQSSGSHFLSNVCWFKEFVRTAIENRTHNLSNIFICDWYCILYISIRTSRMMIMLTFYRIWQFTNTDFRIPIFPPEPVRRCYRLK